MGWIVERRTAVDRDSKCECVRTKFTLIVCVAFCIIKRKGRKGVCLSVRNNRATVEKAVVCSIAALFLFQSVNKFMKRCIEISSRI